MAEDVKDLLVRLSLDNQQLLKQNKKMQNQMDNTAKKTGKLQGAFNKLKFGYIAIAGVISGKVVQAFANATKRAALFQQSITATQKQFGVDTTKLLKSLRKVSDGTISDFNLIQSANKAFALNVTQDIGELSKLLEVARIRGQALGVDTAQAFEDLTTGIGRNSPLILDNLGIVTKGWAEEAKAAGVAYDQQFILNKVLEDGAGILEKTGGITLTTAEKIGKFKVFADNAALAIGKKLLPVAEKLADGLVGIVAAANKISDINKRFEISTKVVQTYLFWFKALVNVFKVSFGQGIRTAISFGKKWATFWVSLAKRTRDIVKGNKEAFAGFGEEVKGLLKDLRDDFKRPYENIVQDFKNFLGELTGAEKNREEEQKKQRKKRVEEEKKTNTEIFNDFIEKEKEKIDFAIDSAQVLSDSLFQLNAQNSQALLDQDNVFREQLKALDEEDAVREAADLQRRIDEANAAGDTQLANDLEREQKRTELEKKADEEERKLKLKAFKDQKNADTIQSIINTALATSRALATPPAPNLIAAGAAGFAGIAQTALIRSQPIPKFQEGGVINGLPGGFGAEDGIIAAQNGESVLNRQATAVLGEDAVNALNRGQRPIESSVVINVADGRGAVDMLDDYFKTRGTSQRGLSL